MTKTKLERLHERKKILSEKIRSARSKAVAQARQQKRRKEAVLGRCALEWMQQDDEFKKACLERLKTASLSEVERQLFEF